MFEAAGNIHMHTTYSDGTGSHQEIADAAIAAGLDFVIVTDHNVWVNGVEGYYHNEHGRVLLLVGEEVHDVRRQPQCNHCLVIGAEVGMSPHAQQPQALIEATKKAGGYTFLAHPYDQPAAAIGERSYPWRDWDLEGFTGLELWNYMSSIKEPMTNKLRAIQAAYRPEQLFDGPPAQTLAKWDELLTAGKQVSVVGGSDGHAFEYEMGPLKRTIFPYEDMFRCVNTHVLLDEPLAGELAQDKPRILQAIGRGRGWVGYDLPHPTKGFRFSGQSLTKGIMGDKIKMDAGATLQVIAPTKCDMRIIHNGQVAAEAKNDISLTHLPLDLGAYRAECRIQFEGQQRGWIFSNPIYLV